MTGRKKEIYIPVEFRPKDPVGAKCLLIKLEPKGPGYKGEVYCVEMENCRGE